VCKCDRHSKCNEANGDCECVKPASDATINLICGDNGKTYDNEDSLDFDACSRNVIIEKVNDGNCVKAGMNMRKLESQDKNLVCYLKGDFSKNFCPVTSQDTES